VLCGFLPLLTFVLLYFFPVLEPNAFLLSCIMTAVITFVVGSLRSLLIAKPWFLAGLEMLLLTAAASTVAYLIGYGLQGLA
jgi:VIT1/CCC1 family predicted Fe2+/Mn2+ transporter